MFLSNFGSNWTVANSSRVGPLVIHGMSIIAIIHILWYIWFQIHLKVTRTPLNVLIYRHRYGSKMKPRCTCTSASHSHQIIIKTHVGSIAKKLPNAYFINFTKSFMKYMQQVFTHVTFNNYAFISSHIIVLSNNSQSESKWNYLGWIYTFVEIPVYCACTKLPENAPLLWRAVIPPVVDISEKGTVLSFCSLPTATCYTAYYLPISGGGPNMGSGLGVMNKRNGERSAKLTNQFTLRGRQGWWNYRLLHKLAYCYAITKNDNLLHIPFWFGYINRARKSDA